MFVILNRVLPATPGLLWGLLRQTLLGVAAPIPRIAPLLQSDSANFWKCHAVAVAKTLWSSIWEA